ncbi:68_t:CDS:1, partial [Acaulospora colombiana]
QNDQQFHYFGSKIPGFDPTSDAAVKQILLQMNDRRRDEDAFVIEDLDQTHILIKADQEESMRQELEIEVSWRVQCFYSVYHSKEANWANMTAVGKEYIHRGCMISFYDGVFVSNWVTFCSTCSAD